MNTNAGRDDDSTNNDKSDTASMITNDQNDDLDSEPSINLRRKFKGNLRTFFLIFYINVSNQ